MATDHDPPQLDAAAVRRRLAQHPEVAHSTIEIHTAPLHQRP